MGRTLGIWVTLALVLAGTPAMAQPGQTPPPQPRPYPPPQPQQYPAPAPAQPAQVTPEEYRLLVRGELSQGQHVGGGLLGTFIGFGSGHLVQERWGDKGWMFTVGESISYGFFLAGVFDCWAEAYADGRCHEGYIIGGAIVFAVLRVWEIVDVWAYPPDHNRRVRELRARVYGPAYYQQYQQPRPPPPVYMRAVDGGVTGGITLRF